MAIFHLLIFLNFLSILFLFLKKIPNFSVFRVLSFLIRVCYKESIDFKQKKAQEDFT